MDMVTALFVAPFASMWDNPQFLLEVIIGGLLAGVMYSLVALGFVLIFKASGVFNFAQGTMVLFAALTFVGLINQFDLVAAAVAGSLVAALALFFQKTAIGRALRAVADDHQAAQSVGIPLRTIWVIVWSVAGIVGLVAGIMWGSNLGVQFSISLVALKALPVLILGGFTSVPGAIVGGLIVGVGEKIAEVFWGPAFGGAIEDWFAYD